MCNISCIFCETVNSSFTTSRNTFFGISFRTFVNAVMRSNRLASTSVSLEIADPSGWRAPTLENKRFCCDSIWANCDAASLNFLYSNNLLTSSALGSSSASSWFAWPGGSSICDFICINVAAITRNSPAMSRSKSCISSRYSRY